jgi:urease accessory protein
LPQETILFDQARAIRSIAIDLADSATFVACEIVVFGRAAMGEVMTTGAFTDRWRLRRGGKLVFAENVRGAAEDVPEDFQTDVGISCWNGFAMARFCAQDAAKLRADMMAVLARSGATLPRMWLN